MVMLVLSIYCFVVMGIIILNILKFNPKEARFKLKRGFIYFVNKFIRNTEDGIYKGVEKGTIKGIKKKVLFFLNSLKEDMRLRVNIPLTEWLVLLTIVIFVISFIISRIIIGNIFFMIIITPFVTIMLICVLYTITTKERYKRQEAEIQIENIISNDMQKGILKAVKDNLNSIPTQYKKIFETFLNDVYIRKYDIERALNLLSISLGNSSVKFIEKVIAFEKKKEENAEQMFVETVVVNNIRIANRKKINAEIRKMELDFWMTVGASILIIVVEILFLPMARWFYIRTIWGNILIVISLIILTIGYTMITLIKAKEI